MSTLTINEAFQFASSLLFCVTFETLQLRQQYAIACTYIQIFICILWAFSSYDMQYLHRTWRQITFQLIAHNFFFISYFLHDSIVETTTTIFFVCRMLTFMYVNFIQYNQISIIIFWNIHYILTCFPIPNSCWRTFYALSTKYRLAVLVEGTFCCIVNIIFLGILFYSIFFIWLFSMFLHITHEDLF
jgi:hypothetical protein